ncbi:hypothetical protein [Pasteuria penetrans]|uniref:hypothetical protein n=1 Tax=Pasteuria penetrans TaxID=86005 RepID=UPI000F94D79E|nr:hypothetical protein [Pasteuria penetrans]
MARYLSQVIALLVLLGIGTAWGMQVTEKNIQASRGLEGTSQLMNLPIEGGIRKYLPRHEGDRLREPIEEFSRAGDPPPVEMGLGNQIGQWLQSSTGFVLDGIVGVIQWAIG